MKMSKLCPHLESLVVKFCYAESDVAHRVLPPCQASTCLLAIHKPFEWIPNILQIFPDMSCSVVTWLSCTLGCFIKDTLKKNKNRNPVRNWGVPRKNISRRREWSNKSRGLLNTLKVWRKIGEIGGRRGIDYGCDTEYQVLKAVFLMHCPDSVFHNLDKPETYNLKSRTI